MPDWELRIREAIAKRPPPVEAYIFLRDAEEGFCNAVVLGCLDGNDYYVNRNKSAPPALHDLQAIVRGLESLRIP